MLTAAAIKRLRLGLHGRAELLILGAGAVTLAVAGLSAGQFSLALFTAEETVDGAFSTGTVVLDPAKIGGLTLTTSAMMPGSSTTDDVVVENDGSAPLRYAVSTSSSNPDSKALRDVLALTIKTIDVTTPASPCDNFDGTVLVNAAVFGANSAKLGDAAAGAHSGDRVLAAGASETLCFRVSLPIATGNAYQGASTTTTFTFAAEQTANNP